MACACQDKVNNTYGRCPACNEAIAHNIPVSRHSCQWGTWARAGARPPPARASPARGRLHLSSG